MLLRPTTCRRWSRRTSSDRSAVNSALEVGAIPFTASCPSPYWGSTHVLQAEHSPVRSWPEGPEEPGPSLFCLIMHICLKPVFRIHLSHHLQETETWAERRVQGMISLVVNAAAMWETVKPRFRWELSRGTSLLLKLFIDQVLKAFPDMR